MSKPGFIVVHVRIGVGMAEVVIALLAERGFDAFEESDAGVDAFIPESTFSESETRAALAVLPEDSYSLSIESIPAKNWNAEWESAYPSVTVDRFCQIVPSFRTPGEGYEYSLVIDPKMSFGTGHHATTRLMIRLMQGLDFSGKNVLDMGCGTGVLGILASKMGADRILGIDIDPWSSENTGENMQSNGVTNMEVRTGDISLLDPMPCDVILANINRAVLLADLEAYASHLTSDGALLLSGFLQSDLSHMTKACNIRGLDVLHLQTEAEWAALHCCKS